ncbi:hypothetical protein [Pedobacter frigidisoli]|uniref:hypothetical protein n=1 Tax=Pedobacter frigidisoli TaxID=2530455 RepID=UPI00292D75E4|nr:hypothetical protein [Pedobacter frigidisoli]
MNTPYHYSGLMTQSEFTIRYQCCISRIASGYTQEEVSFLMGKQPYFYRDYEELNDGVKLHDNDKLALKAIFHSTSDVELNLIPDPYGFHEKRAIRGIKTYQAGKIQYCLIHPWDVVNKKKGTKENSRITYEEYDYIIPDDARLEIINKYKTAVMKLLERSFFKYPQQPVDIYTHLKFSRFDPMIKPLFVKLAVYELMASKHLHMKTIENKIHYHG